MVRGIETAAAVLPLRKTDANHPDAGRLIFALRQIGYSLEQAIADLVDNSINAGAENVLIRFLHDGNQIKAIALVDDGSGMTEAELNDAMRFGSSEKDDPATLGKFGMGMKLASMSHARQLSVYTRAEGISAARRWTIDGISSGWWCERLTKPVATSIIERSWGSLDLSDSGTVVLWEHIDRLPSHRSGLRHTLSALERRLRLHLGLCFHRFLESGKLRLWLDQMPIDRVGQGLQSQLLPLNPFAYPCPGHDCYPKSLHADLTGIGRLKMECHIWPPHSESEEYRLGRKAAARQGLYFYRNNRLIQTGGWNGLVADETEPHSSLARVAVDLPIAYDDWFGINVQKSSVQVPPVFSDVLTATADDGTSFDDYRHAAQSVYRNANSAEKTAAPYPAKGLPIDILKNVRQLYADNEEVDGFSIKWRRLSRGEFFRLDNDRRELVLNSIHRRKTPEAAALESMIKLLLATLVRKDFQTVPGKKRNRELSALNDMLLSLTDNR